MDFSQFEQLFSLFFSFASSFPLTLVRVHSTIGQGSDEILQGFGVAIKMGGESHAFESVIFEYFQASRLTSSVSSFLSFLSITKATKKDFDSCVAIHPTCEFQTRFEKLGENEDGMKLYASLTRISPPFCTIFQLPRSSSR